MCYFKLISLTVNNISLHTIIKLQSAKLYIKFFSKPPKWTKSLRIKENPNKEKYLFLDQFFFFISINNFKYQHSYFRNITQKLPYIFVVYQWPKTNIWLLDIFKNRPIKTMIFILFLDFFILLSIVTPFFIHFIIIKE